LATGCHCWLLDLGTRFWRGLEASAKATKHYWCTCHLSDLVGDELEREIDLTADAILADFFLACEEAQDEADRTRNEEGP
jgi:hypothetical protein